MSRARAGRDARGPVQLVVVGSVALDTIETPAGRRAEILGGSASYACGAASFFARVGMVGVVGTDFPAEARDLYRRWGLDLAGLQTCQGKTFRWSGVYEANMDHRRTLCTDLNVFASFSPEMPAAYRRSRLVFLANIAPGLQLHVLEQVVHPRFVMADTMDLWIQTARADLERVISRVDLLTLNEFEARHLTGETDLLRAAQALRAMGPRYVLVKRGEHGSLLVCREGVFLMPAFPVGRVEDPTGAGDAFAGGLMGALANRPRITCAAVHRAMLYGSVVASFVVEAFGLERLARLTRSAIEKRARQLRRMIGWK